MTQKRRIRSLLLGLSACLLLAGCGKKQASPSPAPAPAETVIAAPATPVPTPAPTPEPELKIMGRVLNPGDTAVELRGLKESEAAEAAAVLRRMPALQIIRLGNETDTPLSWESIALLHDAAPRAVIDYGFTMFDRPFNLSDQSMD